MVGAEEVESVFKCVELFKDGRVAGCVGAGC